MSRHWGSENSSSLRLSRLVERTEVLGPGSRALVIVQGCELRCRGCIAPATHRLAGGWEISVEDLAEQLSSLEGISGITFSGGEPFLQAPAISRLIDSLRGERPGLSTMSYSGYRVEWLTNNASPAQRSLLRRLDLLVDGPYVERQHAPLRWRGSRNQRLHDLSGRHRKEVEAGDEGSAGMELSLDSEQTLEWVGVPPVPDFADHIDALRAA